MKKLYVVIMLALLAGCGAGTGAVDPTAPPTAAPTMAASATDRPTAMAAPSAASPTATAAPEATATMEGMEGMDHDMQGMAHGMGEQVAVPIKLFIFKPEVLEVAVGTTIEWTNEDDIQHSVTHGTPGAPGDAFDSGFFTLGQSFSHTFDEPGTYPYFCMRHPSMTGTVEVRS